MCVRGLWGTQQFALMGSPPSRLFARPWAHTESPPLLQCLGRKETGPSGQVWTLLLELVWEPRGGEWSPAGQTGTGRGL